MAGKFLEQSKVVTGSYDRTLKIWDLRSRACKYALYYRFNIKEILIVCIYQLISTYWWCYHIIKCMMYICYCQLSPWFILS